MNGLIVIQKIWQIILVCACLLCASSSGWCFPDKYDTKIRKATAIWLPGIDYRLYKAQLYQESRFRTDAVSPVGAAGVAQFMPATWNEISKAMGFEGVTPFMAEPSIQAGAFYMARLRKGWTSPRPEADRHSLAMASYNAGFGNILKAQRLCSMKSLYNEIIKCLPQVTGHHSKETIEYSRKIWGFYKIMIVGG